jgi:uncharacterized membrane protein YeiH
LTAVFGGIVGDLLGREPSIVLNREASVSVSIVGTWINVVLDGLGGDGELRAVMNFIFAIAPRDFALAIGSSMPPVRSPPARL